MVADCMEKNNLHALELWVQRRTIMMYDMNSDAAEKTLNNYDEVQSFLMKWRALQRGTNFNPLGYHGGNHAVQLNGGCASLSC